MVPFQFITHRTARYSELDGARAVIAGGCRWVQLRMKTATAGQIVSVGRELSCICREAGAKLIIDDHVELVREICADGVHLGKNDMPVSEARKILGPEIIIGATANEFSDIEKAVAAGADYIGLGPFRFTTTKSNLSPIIGIDGYCRILGQCRREGISVPIVAIGGITANDLPALFRTGVSGVAMSGSILSSADPLEETRRIMEILNKYL